MSAPSLNDVLKAHGLTTRPDRHHRKHIMRGDEIVLTGTADTVWQWLRHRRLWNDVDLDTALVVRNGDRHGLARCTWGEFCRDNDLSGDDAGEVLLALQLYGTAEFGGGAEPLITVEVAPC
jgi:hypothetical protein